MSSLPLKVVRLVSRSECRRQVSGLKSDQSSSLLRWRYPGVPDTPIVSRFPVRKRNAASLVAILDGEEPRNLQWRFESKSKWKTTDGWNWKTMSLAGILLAAVAKSSADSGYFTDWFTVHAAKPFANDGDDCDRNRTIIRRRSYDFGDETSGMSKRSQFNFVADVVEQAAKAVVCIHVKDHSMIDLLHGTPRTASNGSGFIIREDGLILTNAHVVNASGRTAIAVHLYDGKVYAGQLEAVDPEADLALIRIREKGLPTLKLANSAETRLGEWVVAIGSPLSLSNSVTAGVVSNVKRGASELGIRNDISYIQTDAAITFGNSGGPLVNLDGEAIGINTIKVAAGISFAIPSDRVKQFLAQSDDRKKSGNAKPFRRYIGLAFLTLSPDIAAELEQRMDFSLPTKGVFVWSVVVGSPAYVAGIQPGDVIQKVNDADVSATKDVYDVLEKAHSLQFLILRRGQKYVCSVHPKDGPHFSTPQ
ncbi:unnamed protein product [Allacma fusca]|uniref:Serine protease HTRA2, mitochondrial n=1 Tax=Allacma fusca TaxID=39272 RepID=A0A8J2LS53_9HEXA|nr:unnamed protein product [Allacma fusca]